ncbi:hypothetical protein Bbelb_257150 [Branchiostoma belcheri]|nr:hypothetical protein Bbelb_257150 [Branchiostoma belcheri]
MEEDDSMAAWHWREGRTARKFVLGAAQRHGLEAADRRSERRKAAARESVGPPPGSGSRSGRLPTGQRLSALQYVSCLWFDNKSWVFAGLGAQSRRQSETETGREKVTEKTVPAHRLPCVCDGNACVLRVFLLALQVSDTASVAACLCTVTELPVLPPHDLDLLGQVSDKATVMTPASCPDQVTSLAKCASNRHTEDGRHSWTGRIDCRSQRRTSGSLYLNGVVTDRPSVSLPFPHPSVSPLSLSPLPPPVCLPFTHPSISLPCVV